ncbi:MAG: type IV pilus modification PilV family protein [Gemmatimonadota bacterium]
MTATRQRPPDDGARGAALVEAMVAVLLLALAGVSLFALLTSSTRSARSAAAEGRAAELAQRASDLVRAGRLSGSSGTIRATFGGEVFRATYARRDDVAPGALEMTVEQPGGGRMLVLRAAREATMPAGT